jgi:hypothetical protein
MPMIAITTKSSTSVKPCDDVRRFLITAAASNLLQKENANWEDESLI